MAGEKPGEDRVLAGGAKYIDFQTDPSRYRHWKLDIQGEVATLMMDVDEKADFIPTTEAPANQEDSELQPMETIELEDDMLTVMPAPSATVAEAAVSAPGCRSTFAVGGADGARRSARRRS